MNLSSPTICEYGMTIHSDDQDALDNLPSLSLSPDDVTAHSPASRPGARKKMARDQIEGQFAGSTGIRMFLLLLGLLLAAGGFGYVQISALQRELLTTRNLVMVAEKHLMDVSGVVTETGQTMSQSDQQVRSELKDINLEIHKLWDLANRRNRQDIDTQEKQLADHEETLKTLKASADSALEQTKQYSVTLGKAVTRLELIERQIKGISTDLVANASTSKEDLEMLTTSVESLRREVGKAATGINALKADMKQQMTQVEGTLQTMDDYRQQINKRLLQLENTANEKQHGKVAGKKKG